MKSPILVIFIDALPLNRANNIVSRLAAETYSKSIPGVGYSINVKAELFAGLKPDDVGYFCEWNYNPESNVNWLVKILSPVLEFLGEKSHFLNRVFHKLITIFLKENVYAIPYRVLPFLKCSGLTAYEHGFKYPTFLSEGKFERVLYSEETVDDKKVFEKALQRLEKETIQHLFVSTAQLDGVMHQFGMDCNEYEQQIELIESYVVKLVNEFMAIHGNEASYFIFSDHGMTPVLEGVSFDIEETFGTPGKESYIYFIDATFFRVWVIDKSLENSMIETFNCMKEGHVLTESERTLYGLINKKHGDIIFMLDESKQFAPSFFGKDTCQAMHGYAPHLDSQAGVFISNKKSGCKEDMGTLDIYNCIKGAI